MTEARIVTVLFTDLVGSTELQTHVGDEHGDAIRRTHFRLLREALAATGGQEVKNLGDGLMVVFPSAVDALRCARRMQRAVARHNLEDPGPALGVRVGINAGEPLPDDEDYFGTAVNVAKRLCDEAEGGQIAVADVVKALAAGRGGFSYEELGPLELKGIGEPVPAVELLWEPLEDEPSTPLGLGREGPAEGDALLVRVLGRIEVRASAGEPWTEPPPQGRQVLALLVSELGRPCRSDRFVEALWGDGAPENARRLVQAIVSRLRGVLEPPDSRGRRLRTVPGGWQLDLSPDAVDVAWFDRLMRDARDLAGDEEPGAVRSRLEEAIALWRGFPYGELGDDPAFMAETRRLEEERLGARELYLELRLRDGEHAGVIGELQELVAEHPLRERAWGLLMEALYGAGRQADALAAYETLRERLIDELGAEPGPELRHLHTAILRREVSATDPSDEPGVPNNLPARRKSFLGRDEELSVVAELLAEHRLVTLTGAGGTGKTHLALEVAARELGRYPDGVFFVDLGPLSRPDAIAGAVASSLGLPSSLVGGGSLHDELIALLSGRKGLLVVDNCEHLIEGCARFVGRVLDRCPGVSILATSREVLRIDGEQTYVVPPLRVPEDDQGLEADAVRLFVERAGKARVDFALTPETAPDVGEICRRLDGLPLAIELAAPQVAYLSPRQIVQRLGDRIHLLEGGREGGSQTLGSALDWSYELLDEDERAAFRRLSVFSGGFSLEAAEAVCPDLPMVRLLRALVWKSLLVADGGGSEVRYRMLETVRAYGRMKLEESVEVEAARDLHRDHFLAWAESFPDERLPFSVLGPMARELHNLRAALAWTEEQGRFDIVARLASTMSSVWVGNVREGRRWLSIGLRAVDEVEPEHRVRVLAVAAYMEVLANAAADGDLARRAVEACDGRPGVWPSLAHGLLCLNSGVRFMLTGDAGFVDEVERLGAEAVDLASADVARGLAHFWLAQGRVLVGDLDGAVPCLSDAVERLGDDVALSVLARAMLAGLLHLTGEHDRAFDIARDVARRARSAPHSELWGWALYCSLPLALELAVRDRAADGVRLVEELLEEAGTLRPPGIEAAVVVTLGGVAEQRGDLERASLLLAVARRALQETGFRTPVDLATYAHYVGRVREALDRDARRRCRERAATVTREEAIALGLRLDATVA